MDATKQKNKIFSDLAFSTLGLAIMHATLQLAVYPFWQRRFGEAELGDILYLLSLINVFCVSLGVSLAYSRLKGNIYGHARNAVYLVILCASGIVIICLSVLAFISDGAQYSFSETSLLCCVAVLTLIRYYSEVEYRISLKFGGLCVYYSIIAAGYLLGAVLTAFTDIWQLTLIFGELFGVIYVLFFGNVLLPDGAPKLREIYSELRLVSVFFFSELLSNLIFNSDRIMLKLIIGSSAVTLYYLASLMGKTVSLVSVSIGGVVMGYLARFDGGMKRGVMKIITLVAGVSVPVGAICLSAASYVFIRIFYPHQIDDVRALLLLANGSQVAYFCANVIGVLLLRFGKPRYQLYINLLYAAAFLIICFPLAVSGGLYSFCIGLFVAALLRLLYAVFLGFWVCDGE